MGRRDRTLVRMTGLPASERGWASEARQPGPGPGGSGRGPARGSRPIPEGRGGRAWQGARRQRPADRASGDEAYRRGLRDAERRGRASPVSFGGLLREPSAKGVARVDRRAISPERSGIAPAGPPDFRGALAHPSHRGWIPKLHRPQPPAVARRPQGVRNCAKSTCPFPWCRRPAPGTNASPRSAVHRPPTNAVPSCPRSHWSKVARSGRAHSPR